MSARVSRNDPCPCGSKKKYKNCHGKKGLHFNGALVRKGILGLIILVIIGWAGKEYVFKAKEAEVASIPSPGQQPKRVMPLIPQPPGPVPPGKVWSPEHGHWHNIATHNHDSTNTVLPKPPGPPPPGKIWSYKDGKWQTSSVKPTAELAGNESQMNYADIKSDSRAQTAKPVEPAAAELNRKKTAELSSKNDGFKNIKGVNLRPKGSVMQ